MDPRGSRTAPRLQQQREEERARREWAAEQRRSPTAAQAERQAAQQRQEAERAAQARLREQLAGRTRPAQQEAAQAERLAAQQERERDRCTAGAASWPVRGRASTSRGHGQLLFAALDQHQGVMPILARPDSLYGMADNAGPIPRARAEACFDEERCTLV